MAIRSIGISTPRSPRATIIPSAAPRIPSIRPRATARSILAMRNGLCPAAWAARRTLWRSSAEAMKDWLTASTPFSSANFRHSRSRVVKASIPRSTPGALSPLRERSSPPAITRHATSFPRTSSTSRRMIPSFRYRVFPFRTDAGRRWKSTDARVASPTMGSVVRVNGSPVWSRTGSAAMAPMRIFSPGRSAMIASRRPVLREALRRFSMTRRWSSKTPWEKFSRATFIPARSS